MEFGGLMIRPVVRVSERSIFCDDVAWGVRGVVGCLRCVWMCFVCFAGVACDVGVAAGSRGLNLSVCWMLQGTVYLMLARRS